MSDLRDVERMLEAAERAAAAEDLAAADELLRDIASIQEAELGPHHPDLAKTLNNRAVVAEKTGRVDAAERFYRQAVAIAAASLPADHSMVAACRENLQEFCRAHGLPIDPLPPPTPAALDTAAGPATIVPVSEQLQTAPRGRSRSLANAAIGMAAVLVAVTFFVIRSCDTSRDTSAPAGPAASAPAPTIGRTAPASPQTPPAPPPSSSGIALITTQLCRTFSTGEARWTCDPAVDPVSPGPLVLYTRVRSPADAIVVHRWYRGDALRQSVNLTIRANATEGYRTYSRQTVEAGEWRVEVRTAAGALLHEQRFVVR